MSDQEKRERFVSPDDLPGTHLRHYDDDGNPVTPPSIGEIHEGILAEAEVRPRPQSIEESMADFPEAGLARMSRDRAHAKEIAEEPVGPFEGLEAAEETDPYAQRWLEQFTEREEERRQQHEAVQWLDPQEVAEEVEVEPVYPEVVVAPRRRSRRIRLIALRRRRR